MTSSTNRHLATLAGIHIMAITLLLGACGREEAPTDPVDAADSLPQAPARFTIFGVVMDSALNVPVAEAIVEAGGRADTTDVAGAFVLSVDSGMATTIEVTADGYEQFSTTRSFDRDDVLNLGLRRLAPYVFGFAVEGDIVSTTLYDLQGAATILRSNDASVFVEGPGFGFLIYGGGWSWVNFSDPLRLGVRVAVGLPGAERAWWFIRDASGAVGSFRCTVGASCKEESGT